MSEFKEPRDQHLALVCGQLTVAELLFLALAFRSPLPWWLGVGAAVLFLPATLFFWIPTLWPDHRDWPSWAARYVDRVFRLVVL